MLDTVFLQILNMSFTASFVILAVIVARLLLKKAPHVISYALWVVVLFRLVCSFSFESAISLLPVRTNPIPQEIMYQQTPQISTGIPLINDSVNAILPAATPDNSMNPIQGWILMGSLVWLVGIAALLIYSVVSLLKLRRRLKDATHEGGNIYTSNSLPSPFVMGLLRPKIYLPTSLTDGERQYILLHEQTHIKRFDHVVKIVSFFVLCLHWFNPLVWVAFFFSGRDMELSCDEAVIKKLGSEVKKDYSSSLLTLATGRRIVGGSPLAFGEGDTKSRIKNVLNYKKPAFWVIVLSVVAVIIFGISLMSNPKGDDNNHFANSAKDIANQYTLALASSDISQMRQLTPALNPPAQEVIDTWRQIKIESIDILHEDIRETKAVFALSVMVKEAPDGFGMWTPGTATHYLYAEKCDSGWYVESYAAGGRTGSDLETWWMQPNLIDSGTSFDLKPMLMTEGKLYLDTNMTISASIDDSAVVGKVLTSIDSTKRPTEDGQVNFNAVGAKYAVYGDDIVVQIDNQWFLFVKEAYATNTDVDSASMTEAEVAMIAPIVNSYYAGQSSRAFKMLQKSIFQNWVEYDNNGLLQNLVNPKWDFDRFTKYTILDANMNVVPDKDLYYCTFSDDSGRNGYIVVAYHGDNLEKISKVETPHPYDLRANIEDITAKLTETDVDLATAVAARVQVADAEQSSSREAILITDGNKNQYLYYFDEPDAAA